MGENSEKAGVCKAGRELSLETEPFQNPNTRLSWPKNCEKINIYGVSHSVYVFCYGSLG